MAVQDRAAPQALAGGVPPVALLLVGATSVQFGAALGATMFDDVGPAGASLLRIGFAAAILMALWRPRVRGRTAAEWRLVAGFGVALGGMNLCFYEGLERIPLGVAVTIEFIGPVGVAVALSRRRLDLVWVGLAVAGILLLADPFGAGRLDTVGLVFILVAAACWAAYILLAQRAVHSFSGARGLALAMCVAALVPVVPGIAEGGSGLLRPELLLFGAGVALMSSVVPYSLESMALRRLPTHVFGVLMSLEPAVATLAGFVVLGERLGGRDLVAIALVVIASIGATRAATPTPEA